MFYDTNNKQVKVKLFTYGHESSQGYSVGRLVPW